MTPPSDTADAWLQFAHGGLSPRRVESLLTRFGSPGGAVSAITRGRASVTDHVRRAVGIPATQRRDELAELSAEFQLAGVSHLWARLNRFPSGPRWLFTKGSVPDRPVIAIVGTRTCTAYGEELAEGYGEAAARSGWLVVSGMAKGIDGSAHRGAIAGGGSTLAVLGSGVDVVYPRCHRTLYGRILETGAVVSEYPPRTRPDAWRFPTRNRIISALADIVLVVEAAQTGGALITAGLALEQGVPVFATPGDVDRSSSAGTNRLIRDGAFPVFDPDDLARVLELVVPFTARREEASGGG